MQRDRSAQMSEIPPGTFKSRSRGNWIRLRTLVVLRWWAIAGQVTALIVAQRLYNLDLEIGLCFLVIGVSVVSNLVAAFIYPENKRLSESETLLVVLFDMLQLGLLLFLTGGLNNPFSILIVGPVTVSASAISSRRADTGSASGNVIGGTGLARARRASRAAASASGVGFGRRGRRPSPPGWRAGRLASLGWGREGAAERGRAWESDIGRDYNPRIFPAPAALCAYPVPRP